MSTNPEAYLEGLIFSLYNRLEPVSSDLHSSCDLDSGYDYVSCTCGLDDLLTEVRELLGLNNDQ